ncbi:DEAD/DEAH box helicase [Candidatus Woesearchaeota archaeon]|nr:DEAD/DEAH box helicase [Candidatus Woesearchaeota archaeon]
MNISLFLEKCYCGERKRMNLFERFGLSHELMAMIKDMGFDTPTKIQELSIPHILKRKDVIGESATGSGKTLAFGCGIVENVIPGKGIQALVLTPTRELTQQVEGFLKKMSRCLKMTTVYGGVSLENQVEELKSADVVVATPGRLLDHLQRGTIDLSQIKVFVLDEADRMFDMGFIDDVEKIISQCPRERQNLFFSATISTKVRELADKHINNPEMVSGIKMVDPHKLKQVYYDVPRNLKIALLIQVLSKEEEGLVMVFCNSRRNVDFVTKNLKLHKINAIAIHGGYSQNKRNKTMQTFDQGKATVLVCTDVAARGLDIDNVKQVVNYDIPRDSNDYVHRIGRTARAGEEGMVVNILCDYDHDNFSRIFRDFDFVIEKMQRPYLKKVRILMDRKPNRRDGFGSGRGRGRPSQRRRRR